MHRSRVPALGQRLLLRVRRPGPRRLVGLAYQLLARAAAAYVCRGARGAAVYVRGSTGTAEFRPGLSDVDLVVVFAEAADARRARERWGRVRERFGWMDMLVDMPRIYDEMGLRAYAGFNSFTTERAVYAGEHHSTDTMRTVERPGLYSTARSWRLIAGPDRRPPERERDRHDVRLAAWLELVFAWRMVYRFCVEPELPRTADICVKHVAEPARIWLWLVHGERVANRSEALARAASLLPDERDALGAFLELDRRIHLAPAPPLADALSVALRLTRRIATVIADEVERDRDGVDEVRLVGDPRADGSGLLALPDFRSVTRPEPLEPAWLPVDGRADDPVAIAAAASAYVHPVYRSIRDGSLMLMPVTDWWQSGLRGLKAPFADPVPFALLDGAPVAIFPRIRGWSAADMVRRAIDEHTIAIRTATEPRVLLNAARAALLRESLDAGEPELLVSAAATAQRLGEHCDPGDAGDLRRFVVGMPAYR